MIPRERWGVLCLLGRETLGRRRTSPANSELDGGTHCLLHDTADMQRAHPFCGLEMPRGSHWATAARGFIPARHL